MKSKWRKWCYLTSVWILIGSSFSLATFTIYFFTKQQFIKSETAPTLLPPPIFNRTEINQLTTPWGIKLDLFKDLIRQKTIAQINHFYVNDENTTWKINIVYSWENQIGNWIYELKYD